MRPKPIHILHVEDNPLDVIVVRNLLERADTGLQQFRVAHVASLTDAIAYLGLVRVDAVLLDLGLPDSHGLATACELRKSAADLAVVVLTDVEDATLAVQALQLGVQDFLMKDRLDREVLERAVVHAIEQVESLERVRVMHKLLQSALNAMVDHIAILDQAGVILTVNQPWRQAPASTHPLAAPFDTGVSLLLACEMAVQDGGTGADDARRVAAGLTTMLAAPGGVFEHEFACAIERGRRWYKLRVTRFGDADPVRLVVSREDVTALKLAQEQLQHAVKMEAIGRLSSGIANDFNNLLSVIIGCGNLARDTLADDHPARVDLDEVLAAAGQGVRLTRQLLSHTSQEPHNPLPAQLNDLVRSVEDMLARVMGRDCVVTTHLQADLPLVRLDEPRFEQVLLHLAVNARDAMPGGGELSLSTATIDVGRTESDISSGLKPGRYVLLTVGDTGIGVDDKARTRLFEPFFTTKPASSGLGLAATYGIVKQCGGHILVDSERNRGCTFRIYLPVCRAD